MKLIARENGGMEVRIEKENFTISMGEDLVETRDKFLEYMGHMFDEAVYAALGQVEVKEDDMIYIPNTIALSQGFGYSRR